MNKPLPNWAMWKHVPQLRDVEAVALSLDLDPGKVYEWSKNKWVYNNSSRGSATTVSEFADRLFLFRKCFGLYAKTRLGQFAAWAKSVGWVIPDELQALAEIPKQATEEQSQLGVPIATSTEEAPPQEELDAAGMTRREQQILAIEELSGILGYDIQRIPDGGKRILMNLCRYARPTLFGASVHPFEGAWKEARRQERVKMADHDDYAGK